MAKAGADIIVCHLGLTTGGTIEPGPGAGSSARESLTSGRKPRSTSTRTPSSLSSGSATGPPWTRTIASGFYVKRRFRPLVNKFRAFLELASGMAPIVPPAVRPRWQTITSAPAFAIACASSTEKT